MSAVNQELYRLLTGKELESPTYRITVPYGMWKTRVLEILQTVFSPMYRHVWQQNWNNSTFATMKQSHVFCDFENGLYEVYVPTTLDASNVMHYWRIIVKVYDEIDEESLQQNQKALVNPYLRPIGIIDSETICHLAQTTTQKHRHKLRCLWKQGGRKAWFKGLIRGFKHTKKRGYFTPVVVHQSPDIAIKRLLSLLVKFLEKRITAFLKKLKLQRWMFSEYLVKRHNNSLLILVEHFSVTIRQILKSFIETFDWLRMKLKDLYAEIGRQNVQQTKIKPLLREIRQVVDVFRQSNSLKNVDVPDPPIIRQLITVLNIG